MAAAGRTFEPEQPAETRHRDGRGNGCSAVFEQGQGKVPVQARGCGGVGYRRKAGVGEDDCASWASGRLR